jgi:hypothetical protein
MGIAFVTGGVIGSACGYAAGRAGQAKPVDASTTEELQPTGNADLDEMRRLAVKAPIEELMGHAWSFLRAVAQEYRDDEIAWRGVGRIASQLVRNESQPDRVRLASYATQIIDGNPALRAQLNDVLSKLRLIR